MYMTCGDIQGGWRQIADIQSGENCPPSWKSLTIPGTSIKACRSGQDAAGIYSATYSTNASCTGGFQHFCGKVVGIQKGSTDAFRFENQIDNAYLDGLSFTYGTPRKHLWSLAIGWSTTANRLYSANCPCSKYPGQFPLSFVRDHFYCYRQLSMEVKEDIEVRLAVSDVCAHEAVIIKTMELYVM